MFEASAGRRLAARQLSAFGDPLPSDWLDLSTAVNPHAYPLPAIDPAWWQRLPDDDDGLDEAAAAYYGNERLLALAGSSAAMRWLPSLFSPRVVACLTPIDEEHPLAWERAGHKVRRLPNALPERALAAATPIVVVGNPNDHTGRILPAGTLLDAAMELGRRGGCLVVDEAFADPYPENSLTAHAGSDQTPNLIVLRSFGNFFGLAGAQVSFVFASRARIEILRRGVGLWPLAGPVRAVARHALRDPDWPVATRRRLGQDSERLAGLLAPCGEVARHALFVSVGTPDAGTLFEHLARHAILSRYLPAYGLIRCGLPAGEPGWQRLANAVHAWRH